MADTAGDTLAGIGADPSVGQETGRESSLSSWAGDYVTNMLGQGQALGTQDYVGYGGPLTAGASDLQNTAFGGIGGLTIPTEQMGAFTPGTFDAAAAQQYMNPYLSAALQPQIQAAQLAAEKQRLADAGRLTQAGAYGGSRQAIMEAAGNRDLMQNMSNINATGYADAYDKAMAQFNAEQGRQQTAQDATNLYGLSALQKQADMGATQRAIEGEGITEDRLQFEEERDFPYKQVQYMQSLLQGLPIAAQSYSYSQPSELSNILSGAGGIMDFFNLLFPNTTNPPANTTETTT